MKKLSLRLDELRVDSFDTTPVESKRKGTVFGEQCTCYTACTCPGCPSCNTCDTCDTCRQTCDGSTCITFRETCEGYGCTEYRVCY
jgi:hypothetical protein